MWNACISSLCCCNERTHINMWVNKLLFWALESLPVILLVSHHQRWSSKLNSLNSYHRSESTWKCTVYSGSLQIDTLLSYKLDALLTDFQHTLSPSVTPPAVLPTVVPSLMEIQCQLAYHIYGCNALWAMYMLALLLPQNGLRISLRAPNFYKFLEGTCPQNPL